MLMGFWAASRNPTCTAISWMAQGKSSSFAFDSKMLFYFFSCPLGQCSVFALEASRSNFSNTSFFWGIEPIWMIKISVHFLMSSHSRDLMLFITPLICVCHPFSCCAECHSQLGTVTYIAEMNFRRIKKDTKAISIKKSVQMTLYNHTYN